MLPTRLAVGSPCDASRCPLEGPQGTELHSGMNAAGWMAAFTAAGAFYATRREPIIPVYVFYSMFVFQRAGFGADLAASAAEAAVDPRVCWPAKGPATRPVPSRP